MKNHAPKFKDSKGKLTAYSFACGYKEVFVKDNIEREIFRYGATHFYNVRMFDTQKNNMRIAWENFGTLKEARKFANKKF